VDVLRIVTVVVTDEKTVTDAGIVVVTAAAVAVVGSVVVSRTTVVDVTVANSIGVEVVRTVAEVVTTTD